MISGNIFKKICLTQVIKSDPSFLQAVDFQRKSGYNSTSSSVMNIKSDDVLKRSKVDKTINQHSHSQAIDHTNKKPKINKQI